MRACKNASRLPLGPWITQSLTPSTSKPIFASGGAALRARVEALVRAGVPVSLFIAPSEEQLRASAAIGARDPASRYGGSGLGLYGSVGRPQLFVAPLTFWLFEIALAVAWTSRFRFGPLEALWRGLYRGDFSLGGGERHGSSGPG